ncbi:hypothetical protein PanWU01x14_210330 [Parasponia andersonii]|uniref:Transmembrane protein n=1 Tax=Parasponia andersonii TaxID=3476 RepID=A0A2P5BU54_PARAD|nr:hypothetical protein PanWU01x14_210330 [Parasponia andersonii]
MMASQDVQISIEQQPELSNDDKGLINKLDSARQRIKSGAQGVAKDDQRVIKIQRVPKIMLQKGNFEEYFRPRELAIGPLHSKTRRLRKKDLKHRLAAKFIADSDQTGETLLKEIKKNITEIKKRFDRKVINNMSYDDDKLARMLFLDGCSVLQFIYSYVNDDLKSFEINSGQAAWIRHDLFLLENQIPFRVLMVLMNLSVHTMKLAKNIYRFIFMNIMAPVNYYSHRRHERYLSRLGSNKLFIGNKEPVHLLDLLRSELLFEDGRDITVQGHAGKAQDPLFSDYRRSFRNVQDLKAVGIKLKPRYTSGLRSVSFSSRYFIFGQLKLPPLIVDDSTARKLLNLVAYEMCPDNYKTNYAVTSYLSFLDSLIDSEQDVKDLRSAHILRNHLSSDAEVAQLFNSIGSHLVPHDTYFEVKNEIQRHYERRVVVWIAQFYKDHFRSPWTILALLAAATVLLFTAIQAYYAVNPKK